MGEHHARWSVVVPAHNEEHRIGDLLRGILDGAADGELEVVVVVNGTTDRTAQIARSVPGVTVVEIETASKVAALNAGDAVASVFPRVYLDADVGITAGSLRAVFQELEDGALAAAPLPTFDLRGCSAGARAYMAVLSRLGYFRGNLVGSGVYGMSAQGRRRFGSFPDVIADDGFVYTRFQVNERRNPSGATFTIRAPRTVRAIYRRRIRIAYGNLQLNALGHRMNPPGPTWFGVVRQEPRLVGAAVVYLAVNGLALLGARRRRRRGVVTAWHQDLTSRIDPVAAR